MVRFDQVSKRYPVSGGVVEALQEVTFHVSRGELVAIRGASGSGKSTLLSLAGGLIRPTQGRIEVDGAELTAMTGAQRSAFRAQRVGFVFQMFHLLPYLSVLDNVLLAAANGADLRARAEDLLHRCGMGHRLRHRPGQLSAGEQQRVAIARALLTGPKVLLADEPTGNLDVDHATAVLDLLNEFRREGGTVMLVTHDDAVASRADRTLHLAHGRLETPASPTAP